MKNLNRTIFIRDNLEVLRCLNDHSIDLIYLDPPFNSNRNYGAPIGSKVAGFHFKDMWYLSDTDTAWWGLLSDKHPALYEILHAIGVVNGNKDKSYLIYIAMRLLEMHRILKDTGSIYLHCDHKMSHSLKLLMDAIFGNKNFKNEIIWHYRRYSAKSKAFQKMHDIIYFYSKSNDYKFNILYQEYQSTNLKNHPWQKDNKGKLFYIKRGKGIQPYKVYMNEKGVSMNDVWLLPQLSPISKERVGYKTQKPLKLLDRIIKASSDAGDTVLDPFCGCATTCVASEKLGRKWIGIDLSPLAGRLIKKRLNKQFEQGELGKTMVYPLIRTDLPIKKAPKPSKNIKHILYGRQEGYCAGCKIHFQIANLTKDHIIPITKGGSDTDNNLQLLCGHCNSVKGNRSMAYLKNYLKTV